eukprot:6168280-Lingulodinium_polyedra.AAC.1
MPPAYHQHCVKTTWRGRRDKRDKASQTCSVCARTPVVRRIYNLLTTKSNSLGKFKPDIPLNYH